MLQSEVKSAYDCHLSTNILTELHAGLESNFVFQRLSQRNIIGWAFLAKFSFFLICSVQVGNFQVRSVVPGKDVSFLVEVALMILLDI